MKPVEFNGPPPDRGGPPKNAELEAIRTACRAQPGEWASVEMSQSQGANWARLLRDQGFEAVKRGDRLYVKWQ